MTLPIFYYASGTAYLWNTPPIVFGPPTPAPVNVKGLDGKVFLWEGGIPNDPFPRLLEPTLWNYERVQYPAQAALGGLSIEAGVDYVISRVTQTPVGTPFAVGGYSQGGAVSSRIYNECRQGRLADRRADLRAVVTFGNPMRQQGHTFSGSSGYSGACDVLGDTRNGHGAFPVWASDDYFGLLTSPFIQRFARLQNTEDLMWDFTMPNEVASGMGSSTFESLFLQNLAGDGLRLSPLNLIVGLAASVVNGVLAKVNQWSTAPLGVPQNGDLLVQIVDALTGAITYSGGGGHVMYPFYPPPNSDGSIPETGDTCYQLAAKYLNTVGARIFDEQNPIVVAPTSRAALSWFTSLPSGS
jgi:hypothetical protein